MGFVERSRLINEILPETDIYLCPTYQEAWGYSILEALAFGIPVITTNHFAIPEMIEHNKSGILIDTNQFDYIKNFKGYIVNDIPSDFMDYMTNEIYQSTKKLITNFEFRKKIGMNGLEVARKKFSIESRNEKMGKIYYDSLES